MSISAELVPVLSSEPTIADLAKALESHGSALSRVLANTDMLVEAYKDLMSQVAALTRIMSRCPPTCPYRQLIEEE